MQEVCCGFKADLNYTVLAQPVLHCKILFGQKQTNKQNALGVTYLIVCCNPVPVLKRS